MRAQITPPIRFTSPPLTQPTMPMQQKRFPFIRCAPGAFLALLLLQPLSAHASMFEGETLDKISDVLTWIVLVIAPVIGLTVFLLIHILPEKIAERKKHPQAGAIQCLCLLSLVFGGLLWPIAWLWAYTKPVLYQMAYGTDKVEPEHGKKAPAPAPAVGAAAADPDDAELRRLCRRIAEIESKRTRKTGPTESE
jgi:CBS domain containing-hemolysin-like protein